MLFLRLIFAFHQYDLWFDEITFLEGKMFDGFRSKLVNCFKGSTKPKVSNFTADSEG